MNDKKFKISYKMLNSFLFTLSMVFFLVSFMFSDAVNSKLLLIALLINILILILRIMLQYVRHKCIVMELFALLLSIYLYVFQMRYQSFWISYIAGGFSYFNHSNLFIKSGLNETFTKICRCTYRKHITGDTEFINVSDINQGDYLQLFSGETVPCDCVVKAGSGTVSYLSVSGDSKIVTVNKGDRILSGLSVLSGKLIVEAENSVLDSSLSKTIRNISSLSEEKTEKEKSFHFINTVITIVLSIIAVSVLLIVCINTKDFDMLIYSLPLVFMLSVDIVGSDIISEAYEAVVGNLASKGIIVKSKKFIEKNLKINNVGFSVKGILGGKKPVIAKVHCEFDMSEDEIISLASYALYRTTSSMAKALISANTFELDISDIRDFKAINEYGGSVKIAGDVEVVAGSVEDLNSYGIIVGLDNSEDTIYVAVDGRFIGYIQFTVPLNDDIFNCMNNLRFAGIKNIFVYSHCRKDIAEKIAKVGNLQDVHGGLTNDEITEKIHSLEGTTLMFRFGENSYKYSDNINEMGYGGYRTEERYESFVLSDNLLPPVHFINAIKDYKSLVIKNFVLSVIIRIVVLLFLIFNVKMIWIPFVLVLLTMFLIRINNLKLKHKF